MLQMANEADIARLPPQNLNHKCLFAHELSIDTLEFCTLEPVCLRDLDSSTTKVLRACLQTCSSRQWQQKTDWCLAGLLQP